MVGYTGCNSELHVCGYRMALIQISRIVEFKDGALKAAPVEDGE